jgi:hypothetical protein
LYYRFSQGRGLLVCVTSRQKAVHEPWSVNYRLRQKEIVSEKTGPQQSTTNKKKIHTHLKTTKKKTTAQDPS